MKVVIPAAGAGARFRPHTHTQPKPLIPIAGKPILGHIVDQFIEVGIYDFVFVVGYMGEKIIGYIEENYQNKISYQIVYQEKRLGLAHAILCCEKLIGNQPFLISLGDSIIDTELDYFIQQEKTILGVEEVDDPTKFGIAVLNDNQEVVFLQEKPTIPRSNLALVGLYRIQETQNLFQSIHHLLNKDLKTQNEYQLTDALLVMLENGIHIHTHKVRKWYDCGSKESLLYTHKTLMQKMTHHSKQHFPSCVIIPPITIGQNCNIRNSILGPYVAIADNTTVISSIIQNSIIGSYAQLDSIILKNSLIGNDASLIGRSQSINIGDSTEINFND